MNYEYYCGCFCTTVLVHLLDGWSNFLQAWNHDFFWSSIYPGGGGQPDGEVLELIERDFGSFEEFTKEFKAAGVNQFGSGWVWLICKCTTIFVVDSNACCHCSP
jgi:Fe-Mn family superoxide dismutase